jgi:hypothetical protein
MKNILTLVVLLFGLMHSISAQQLCMEVRTNDDAIIKDLFVKEGICYITVDVVQVIEHEFGQDIKNENPKLRTFIINPDSEWDICIPNYRKVKIKDAVFMREGMKETFIRYSAKNGRIISSTHYSCAG